MKVYVDELPKSCSYCPCKCFETDTCQLNKGIKCPSDNKIANKCPLQSLTDYTKQVRKEICDKIRKQIKNEYIIFDSEEDRKAFNKILKQIHGVNIYIACKCDKCEKMFEYLGNEVQDLKTNNQKQINVDKVINHKLWGKWW